MKKPFIFMRKGDFTIAVRNNPLDIEMSEDFGYRRIPTSSLSAAEQLQYKAGAVYGYHD